MNKIERAIYNCELHLDKLKNERTILLAKISAYEDQLSDLKAINRDKSIPHIEADQKAEH